MNDWKAQARKIEDAYRERIQDISSYIFNNPELGGREQKSGEYLAKLMEKEGFRVTRPYAGEETGFRAEFGGERGVTIALLAEYDALPGYGPEKKPAHACGHNWIAAVTAGTAIVLAKMMGELPGRVVLIGTPAEETYGGKVRMAEKGAFDGIDIVLQAHLDESTEITPQALAMAAVEFSFTGRAAHAAQFPHLGVNALDGVQLTFAGINALRQHVTSDVRIHGIVTDGGAAPNIVPEHSSCLFYVRAARRAAAEAALERVKNCARGAALMTGAHLEIGEPDSFLWDLINVPVLARLAEENLTENGILEVHRMGSQASGSSDIGNVSYICPTAYMEIGLDDARFLVHEEEALQYADSPLAYKKLHQVVKAMAGMAVDLYTKPALVEQAKREHCKLVEMQRQGG